VHIREIPARGSLTGLDTAKDRSDAPSHCTRTVAPAARRWRGRARAHRGPTGAHALLERGLLVFERSRRQGNSPGLPNGRCAMAMDRLGQMPSRNGEKPPGIVATSTCRRRCSGLPWPRCRGDHTAAVPSQAWRRSGTSPWAVQGMYSCQQLTPAGRSAADHGVQAQPTRADLSPMPSTAAARRPSRSFVLRSAACRDLGSGIATAVRRIHDRQ
jgi:hypothetical protein